MLLRGLAAHLGWQASCQACGALQLARTGLPEAMRRGIAASSGCSTSSGAPPGGDSASSGSGDGGGGPSLADEYQRRIADLGQDQGDVFARMRAAAAAGAGAPSSSGAQPGAAPPGAPEPPPAGGGGAAAGAASSSAAGGGGGARVGPHPLYGYAVLGGVNPETADQEAGAQQPKLHPRKNFRPGDTYEPEDLNPYGGPDDGSLFIPLRRPGASPLFRPEVTAADVKRDLDFRNTALLRHFVSDSGRLRPRRQTRLPRALQKRAAKAVKLARQMALMPFEMVVGDGEPDARSRMLEYEAARSSHRGGGRRGGGGGGAARRGASSFRTPLWSASNTTTKLRLTPTVTLTVLDAVAPPIAPPAAAGASRLQRLITSLAPGPAPATRPTAAAAAAAPAAVAAPAFGAAAARRAAPAPPPPQQQPLLPLPPRDHPVLELVRQRLREGSVPGRRSDGFKLGIAVEGGGMRGIVTGAMLMGLQGFDALEAFDAVYGASAGAINATYFLTGQPEGLDIYTDHLAGSDRFLSLKRYWVGGGAPAMDLSYLLDEVMMEVTPLDWQAAIDSPVPLKVVASSLDTLRAELLEGFSSPDDLRECLKASACVPEIAGVPRLHRGHRLVDAAVFEPIPVKSAVRDGCTHVLALCSRPPSSGPAWGKAAKRTLTAAVKHIMLSPPYMREAWAAEPRHSTHQGRPLEDLLESMAGPTASTLDLSGDEDAYYTQAGRGGGGAAAAAAAAARAREAASDMAGCGRADGVRAADGVGGSHVLPVYPSGGTAFAPVCTHVPTLLRGRQEGYDAMQRALLPALAPRRRGAR
ncbi:MAG: hypothetical protein J3K34DRAFT_458747 [Monoraphidium minutum]|nr:MAG: hypothetical protein J3K34DRAFT_458747 [Monoraphidium minutum]